MGLTWRFTIEVGDAILSWAACLPRVIPRWHQRVVVLDLEDSVAVAEKPATRGIVLSAFQTLIRLVEDNCVFFCCCYYFFLLIQMTLYTIPTQ